MTSIPHLDLTDRQILIPLLQRHGFATRKGLGQHFLVSRKAVEAIIESCAPAEGVPVLEIGPGAGTLTRALAEAGADVTAVEIDARAIELLKETVGDFPAVRIVAGDILAIDLPTLLGSRQWTVVGNLPYAITSPILIRLLAMPGQFIRAVLMVQREVADRLLAPPGGKTYGSLTIYTRVYADVSRVIKVSAGSFLPPPHVDSTVVQLAIRPDPLVPTFLQDTFFRIVRAAFGQRRKMLENALLGGGIFGGDRPALHGALIEAGIVPTERGEALDIPDFLRLAEVIADRQHG